MVPLETTASFEVTYHPPGSYRAGPEEFPWSVKLQKALIESRIINPDTGLFFFMEKEKGGL